MMINKIPLLVWKQIKTCKPEGNALRNEELQKTMQEEANIIIDNELKAEEEE